jgi:Family of unknown function (DUF6941)
MIKHIWSVLCERISVDQQTNLVSYLTCIEEITIAKLPAMHSLFALGSIWRTDHPGEDILKIRLIQISPDRSKKTLIETDDFKLEKERHRTNLILNGIPFDQAGTYVFRIESQSEAIWKTEAEIPLKVTLRAAISKGK